MPAKLASDEFPPPGGTIQVPLDGQATDVRRSDIPLSSLMLDVENPRIQYFLDTRLNESITQDEVKLALAESNGQYERLKEHIEVNGGVYNPIWVVAQDQHFRVIEGNTRALIYQELSEKWVNQEKWRSIPAFVLPVAVDRFKINFIRLEAHLFGPTPWDAYEKARELYRLHTVEDYSMERLAKLTKLSAYDIKNSIQAFMDMQEEYLHSYPRPGEQLKFSYFAEFRKNKTLKYLVRSGRMTLQDFCTLVGEGKLGRGEHVRKLGIVWQDPDSREVLLRESMDAALDQLAQRNPGANSKLFEKMAEVTDGLQRMSFGEYDEIKRGLQPAKVSEIRKLHTVLSNLLADIGVLQS